MRISSETQQWLKEINPGLRAIMITSFDTVDMSMRIISLNADDFQEKLIDIEELLTKIRSIEN